MNNQKEISELSNRNIIKLSNNFIQSEINIKEVSLNIFLTLLAEIKIEDTTLPLFDISIKDIENKMNIAINRNKTTLNAIVNDFTSKSLKLAEESEYMALCSACEIINEENTLFLQISINPLLSEELLNLKTNFTKISLDQLLSLKGIYKKRLYMLLIKMKSLGHWKANLDALQDILNVPDSYKKRYTNFKARVLTSALKQINSLPNKSIAVALKEHKRGSRRVKQLHFTINSIVNNKKVSILTTDSKSILETWGAKRQNIELLAS